MMACLGPGDEFILPEPAYANYLGFAKEADVNVVPVRSDIYNGFALPPISEIEKLITPRTRAILICNPNNPTGYVYSQEELEALRDIVIKHDLFLISDEVYREFCYRGSTAISAFSMEGVDDNVVVVDSVSKRYDECGIRIGTLVTRNKMLYKAVMKYAQARLSPPLLGQVVAEASIGASEEYMKATYDEYISRRDLLVNGLNDIPGVFSPLPMGAFYTVASLPVDDAEEFCRWCLTDFEYQGQTVFMAPAAGFYSNPEDGRNQVRIAYILEKPELTRALQVLEQALRTYNSRADKNSGILRQAQYAG